MLSSSVQHHICVRAGYITTKELGAVIRAVGRSPTEDEVKVRPWKLHIVRPCTRFIRLAHVPRNLRNLWTHTTGG